VLLSRLVIRAFVSRCFNRRATPAAAADTASIGIDRRGGVQPLVAIRQPALPDFWSRIRVTYEPT
jgi:hypothetical protein